MLSWTIDHKETPSEIIQSVPNSDTHKKIAYVPILHFLDVFSDPNQDTLVQNLFSMTNSFHHG